MIALDPQLVCKFNFAGAEFEARYMTCRQWTKFNQLLQEAHACSEGEAVIEKLAAALELTLTGKPFAAKDLPDKLTPRELWMLAYEVMKQLDLSEQKKSNSESPCASSTDSSVPAATANA